jgi:hypothetical protein
MQKRRTNYEMSVKRYCRWFMFTYVETCVRAQMRGWAWKHMYGRADAGLGGGIYVRVRGWAGERVGGQRRVGAKIHRRDKCGCMR